VKRLTAAAGPVHGEVTVPGSKSVANRALVAAALATGESVLTNVPDGDDTSAMLRCLSGLGVRVDGRQAGSASVAGTGGHLRPSTERLDAGLAGTTSRFVTALAALADTPVTVDGDAPLRTRPMGDLHDALVVLGARVDAADGAGHLPVTITGPIRRGGTVRLRGDVSSQFVTALMLIGPVLEAGLRIELTSPLVSAPYVHLTAAVMARFGGPGVDITPDHVAVDAGGYAGATFEVEPDASSASYPLSIAAVRGGAVTVAGLTPSSLQGDIVILELLESMGCEVDAGERSVTVSRPADQPLRGIDINLAESSDLVPTIATIATTASSPTTIRGVGFIRAKESDRLGDLALELARTGALVAETADGLHVEPVPGGAAGLRGAELHTHHDHRLAMAFAVLGTAVDGISVDGPEVVGKSWPGFWTAYERLLAGQ
jgi:3-phosphoshikimate 1-carboxyvinyltransferase